MYELSGVRNFKCTRTSRVTLGPLPPIPEIGKTIESQEKKSYREKNLTEWTSVI